MKPKQYPHIALFVETSNAFSRRLLMGVSEYIRNHGPWSVYLDERKRGDPLPLWLRNWEGDGIIARVENEKIAEAILQSKTPAVNVSATNFNTRMPSVNVDEEANARLAFDHLLNCGFCQFAFCSVGGYTWGRTRCEAFVSVVQEAGFTCHTYEPTSGRHLAWEDEQDKIARWLQELPKPIGLQAAYDLRGRQVLDACRRIGLAVPEEIAVIGTGNDEVLCELAWPPMTSIDSNPRAVGLEAAALLDRLMQGESMEGQHHITIQPISIHPRQSTDIMAIEDSDVAAAVRMIRERACDGINVGDILSRIPLIRKTFEHRFKKIMGRTPHAEILRVRLDRVKRLLKETDLSVPLVAEKAGFKHSGYMSTVFKEKVGQSPSNYRALATRGEVSEET